MLPDRVSNPGPLTYESGALLIGLCGPAAKVKIAELLSLKGNPFTSEYCMVCHCCQNFGECTIINPTFLGFEETSSN